MSLLVSRGTSFLVKFDGQSEAKARELISREVSVFKSGNREDVINRTSAIEEKAMKQLKMSVIIAAVGVLVMLGLRSGAYADQITIGGSTSGLLTFTVDAGGEITVTSTDLSDGAFFTGGALGSYDFGAMDFTAGPVSGEQYPAGANSSTFTFHDGTNTLDGTVMWSFIQDNTTNPKFFGNIDITFIAGSAAFLSTFGSVGSIDGLDFTTTALSSGGTLDALVASGVGKTATAGISSGEITGTTPEPSSIMLFGVGIVLLTLCALPRRRMSAEE
jgi:PEP-CTERM motif